MNSGKQAECKVKGLLRGKVDVERCMGELRESLAFGKFKSFIRGQFSGSLSSLRPMTLLCSLLVNLSQYLPLGYRHTP